MVGHVSITRKEITSISQYNEFGKFLREKRNRRRVRSVNNKKLRFSVIIKKAEEKKLKRGERCLLYIVAATRETHQLVDTHEISPSS
jgi:hypothetical protein